VHLRWGPWDAMERLEAVVICGPESSAGCHREGAIESRGLGGRYLEGSLVLLLRTERRISKWKEYLKMKNRSRSEK
jgi:hypothetical protein